MMSSSTDSDQNPNTPNAAKVAATSSAMRRFATA